MVAQVRRVKTVVRLFPDAANGLVKRQTTMTVAEEVVEDGNCHPGFSGGFVSNINLPYRTP